MPTAIDVRPPKRCEAQLLKLNENLERRVAHKLIEDRLASQMLRLQRDADFLGHIEGWLPFFFP